MDKDTLDLILDALKGKAEITVSEDGSEIMITRTERRRITLGAPDSIMLDALENYGISYTDFIALDYDKQKEILISEGLNPDAHIIFLDDGDESIEE